MLFLKSFVYLFVSPACVSQYDVCALLMEPEEGAGAHETRVRDSFELPRGCWEWHPGPLDKQPVIVTTKLSSQSWIETFFNLHFLVSFIRYQHLAWEE